ncbi:hypothetical protein FOL47_008317 [Perkinsus chesapeaki]|uniref:PPM-type phosphatase domain-containing protein n=1 Tax=Perkinsus chesapeaki TaxID=330153 RepID=A0A7J6LES6_PERCH|nr:hypothetical protein FOL47_008317 [Perkinsus chesapeaki]
MGNKSRNRKSSKGMVSKPDLDVNELANVLASSGDAIASTSTTVTDYGYDGAKLNVQLMQGSTRRVLSALGVTASRDPILLRQAMDFMKRNSDFAAAEKLVEADQGRTMGKYSQGILQGFEADLKAYVTSQQNASLARSESARKLSVLTGTKKPAAKSKVRQMMKGTKASTAALLKAGKGGKPVVINKGTSKEMSKRMSANHRKSLPIQQEAPVISVKKASNERSSVSVSRDAIVSECAAYSKTGKVPVNPKKVNQDSYWMVEELSKDPRCAFFGVADGHGVIGHEVSGMISRRLPKVLSKELESSNSGNTKALERAFKKVNHEVTNANMDVTLSGSSCVSVLITPSKIYCANAGDSRAVLGRRSNGGYWDAVPLSIDHKPDRPDELKRIVNMGGRVEPFRIGILGISVGPSRVWLKKQDLPGLAMSRAFGDTIAASVGVTADPEITNHVLLKEDKFIVIASDGVWDFMTNEEVIRLIAKYYNQESSRKAARALVKEASERWQSNEEVVDDITCVVVFLRDKR